MEVLPSSELALKKINKFKISQRTFLYIKLLNDDKKEQIIGNVYSIACEDKVNVRRPCHLIWDLEAMISDLEYFLRNYELFVYCISNNNHPASTKPSVFPVQILDSNLVLNKNSTKVSENGKYALYNSESGLIGHSYMLVARDRFIEVTRDSVDLIGMFKINLKSGKPFKHRILDDGKLFYFETAKGKDTVWSIEKTGVKKPDTGIAGLIKNLKNPKPDQSFEPETSSKPTTFQQKFTKLFHFTADGSKQTDVSNSGQVTISNGDILAIVPNMFLPKIRPVIESRTSCLNKIFISPEIDTTSGYFTVGISGNAKANGTSYKKIVNRRILTKIQGENELDDNQLFEISLNHIFSKHSPVNINIDVGGDVDTLNSAKLQPIQINDKDANQEDVDNFSFSGDVQMRFSCDIPETLESDLSVGTTPLVEYKNIDKNEQKKILFLISYISQKFCFSYLLNAIFYEMEEEIEASTAAQESQKVGFVKSIFKSLLAAASHLMLPGSSSELSGLLSLNKAHCTESKEEQTKK